VEGALLSLLDAVTRLHRQTFVRLTATHSYGKAYMVKLKLAAAAVVLSALVPGIASAQANPARGKVLFAQCMACHKLDKSGKSTIGPNLFGVVGRSIASVKGFNYSPAMKQKKGTWTSKDLDAYLTAPLKVVPGGRMAYAGMAKAEDRKNLIGYLVSASK